ncbi:MAG: cell division protein FtsX [Pseudobdellovibrionaceae bacterium]
MSLNLSIPTPSPKKPKTPEGTQKKKRMPKFRLPESLPSPRAQRGPSRAILPLKNRQSDRYLTAMLALMTALVMLVTASTVYFASLAGSWESHLKEVATLEIPGSLSSPELMERLKTTLSTQDVIESFTILSREDLLQSVSPWLSLDGLDAGEVPLPTIVTLKLATRDKLALEKLAFTIKAVNKDISFDAHENWLAAAMSNASLIRFLTASVAVALLLVMALTLSMLVRDKILLNMEVISLLHIMGATDGFILKEFHTHMLKLSGQAVLIGLVGALVLIGGAWAFLDPMSSSLNGAPHVTSFVLLLAGLPLLILALVYGTTRASVLSSLGKLA